jgi:hypothetical protein
VRDADSLGFVHGFSFEPFRVGGIAFTGSSSEYSCQRERNSTAFSRAQANASAVSRESASPA